MTNLFQKPLRGKQTQRQDWMSELHPRQQGCKNFVRVNL